MERKLIFQNKATEALGFRKVGNSGLKVSNLGMGTWLNSTSVDTYSQVIRHAFEHGIFHYDTADMYGPLPGWAETMLGQCLSDYERSSYVLSTKVHARVGKWPNDAGLSRKHMMESCDKSLKRLKTDYLDIYYCHRPDPDTPLHETVDALATLKNQGKILYAGVSMWTSEQIREASALAKEARLQIVANQVLYNVIQRPSQDVLDVCEAEGIGLIAYSPLAQGLLSGKYNNASSGSGTMRGHVPHRNKWLQRNMQDHALMSLLDRFIAICDREQLSNVQAALSWLMAQSNVSCSLCGFSSSEQITENCSSVSSLLPERLVKEITDLQSECIRSGG